MVCRKLLSARCYIQCEIIADVLGWRHRSLGPWQIPLFFAKADPASHETMN